MTRDDVGRTLRQMEHVRELALEAEKPRDRKRLDSDWLRMWKAIEPYVRGRVPYDGEALASGQ